MRVVVTGGAGFLGSHLCEALIARGDKVVCLDDLSTGHTDNIMHLIDRPYFEFFETDVSVEIKVDEPVDVVAHFASAASPPDYMRLQLETLAVGSRGTENGLRLARVQQGQVHPGVHERSVRRSSRSSPSRGLLGKREPNRAAQRVRRGEAIWRGANAGI